MEIVYHIREERKKQNITIKKLAELSGVGCSTITDIESGRHHPAVDTLCYIADALSIKPCELFDYESNKVV